MANITTLPDLRMIRGLPFTQDWQLLDPPDVALDLTGWVAVATFSKGPAPLLSKPITTGPNGLVQMYLPPADVASLIGPGTTYQIIITAPDGSLAEVWRGGVIVQ